LPAKRINILSDNPLLIKAASFAAQKHQQQKRKGVAELPYINHPLEVANILANEGGIDDVHTLCGAMLHDVLEDTDSNVAELTAFFGQEITAIVQEVTDDRTLPKAERKKAQLDGITSKSRSAQAIKIADKICNLRDMVALSGAEWPTTERVAYCHWSGEMVERLAAGHPLLAAVFFQTQKTVLAKLEAGPV
jgi:GTP diphosphokinase / guanosine-3',5'-bis(diphosphate) 3'-diphosphatase